MRGGYNPCELLYDSWWYTIMTDIDEAYQKALDYLYSYVDYSLTRNLRYSPDKFNLGRMVELMGRLGNPHSQYPVIHIAGTKGKGSISALIASTLEAAGYKTGLYTSPHLQDYTERIQVNHLQIPREELVALLEEIKPHAEQIDSITTFELTTALGFLYFARQKVNAAVVEVGLGGRLDATNVVTPLVSIISSLSLDHVAVLGDTLAQIAGEKAGIIKPGRPVVLAPQREEARRVVERVARERGSTLIQVGREYLFAPWRHSLDNQSLLVWPANEQALVDEFIESGGRRDWEPLRLTIPLLGYHQVENAATAYTGLQIARQEGLDVKEGAILRSFAQVSWPGRFEVLQRNPPVIVDSAHNQDSALRLRLALDDYLPGQPVILVFGASEDKDIHGMFAELIPRVRQVIATQSEHPRAINSDKLVELAHQFGCPARAITPVENALSWALELAGQEAAVVVAGSIFVAAAAREAWPRLVNNRSYERIL
jgi:dihydrofolate synthase/folylpolyglutamate synthase